ncbi:hypothetical protein VB711_16635 [Cronbergia sp. UHCC 0137]|uniref:hypothetical protein n=1 Tax=Cronbergia sp. UHCC 0137 TaxID=3110239 RepID=UPI002B208C7E|nr:hypothetical protein [Cronbergia sp. UHCC 0137]MEA5619457.1 hypothetical protein [Cronbergia sp. UHCC 0137]
METMKLLAHIGTDGILQIQTHTDFKDKSVEVLVVIQPLDNVEITKIKKICLIDIPIYKYAYGTLKNI